MLRRFLSFMAERPIYVTLAGVAVRLGYGAGHDPHFCANGGTYIWCKYHFCSLPAIALRTATLDDTSIVRPQAHIFVKNKPPCFTLSEDIPAFKDYYVRAEVWPAAGWDRINSGR